MKSIRIPYPIEDNHGQNNTYEGTFLCARISHFDLEVVKTAASLSGTSVSALARHVTLSYAYAIIEDHRCKSPVEDDQTEDDHPH